MQQSHKTTLTNYNILKADARSIAHSPLPDYLKRATKLKEIDHSAIKASKLWSHDSDRKVEFDWTFSNRYIYRHPKSFDLAIWCLYQYWPMKPMRNGLELSNLELSILSMIKFLGLIYSTADLLIILGKRETLIIWFVSYE